MANRKYVGQCASPGFVDGRIVLRAKAGPVIDEQGDAECERKRLAGALEAALDGLGALIGELDGDAADIMEFQAAMLGDEALAEPAFAAIAEGLSAQRAWSQAMQAQIAEYRAADNDYFRARASDLEDIRDTVLAAFGDAVGSLQVPDGAIYLDDDLTPSQFLTTEWAGSGIALRKGSVTSHVAMLARSRRIPMMVDLGDIAATNGERALLHDGRLTCAPDDSDRRAFALARDAFLQSASKDDAVALRPAATADGVPVSVLINVAGPAELAALDPGICDGIGLVRTELMFAADGRMPGEEEQFAAYRSILEWAAGRPVTIRTLDAGGDKPIPGYTFDNESNPFLGVRGIRLSLLRPDVFRLQIRALLRAARFGDLKVMAPMVSRPEEMREVRRLFAEESRDLAGAGVPHDMPALGMMVEVPASAYLFDRFDVDFGSIGSNDLAQYVMAAGRDSAQVCDLANVGEPAVLHAIASAVAGAGKCGVPISLCGDAGSDPDLIPHLLKTGLRSISCAPFAVGAVKRAISHCRESSA